MLRYLFLSLFSMSCFFLHAGSVRLYNNSNFDLRAVVRGSDGSELGEMIVKAQSTVTWTDSYTYAGGYRGPNAQVESGYRSKTPYVVLWYCMDGADYGVCNTVSTGAVVLALGCPGPNLCHPPRKQQQTYPTVPREQYLQPETNQPPGS